MLKNERCKKIFSAILIICMVSTFLIPVNIFAEITDDKLPIMSVSVTSTVNSSLSADKLIDGRKDTFWSSNSNVESPINPDYAELKIGGAANVSAVVLTPRVEEGNVLAFPLSFKFQHMDSKGEWMDIEGQTYTDYQVTTSDQEFIFKNAVSTKSIRVVAIKYGKDDFNTPYFQLAEISLYGEVTAPVPEAIWGKSPISEPYGYVNEGSFSGSEQPFSPDPLVAYRWDNPKSSDDVEIYLRKPVLVDSQTPDSFLNIDSIITDDINVVVKGEGTIRMDFGAEFAGWLEIDVDNPGNVSDLTLGMSEYNQPAFVNSGPQSPSKTKSPERIGNTYRLKLNDEYYEGVRFGFINVESFSQEFSITDVRLVCQTKPVNYNGSFDSDNEMLNKTWYTAAYDVRLNLKKDYIAAILVDRGDRHSWTGDAYPTQAAALSAFANYDFILDNMKYTSVRKNGIESYEMYWIFSLIDYYLYTGDADGVNELLSQATERLDIAYSIYGKNPSLQFFGWDERLGAGFENPNIGDNQLSYKILAIRAWKEFSEVLEDIGEVELAEKYLGYANEKTTELCANPKWYDSLVLHSGSDAINAGITTPQIEGEIYEKYFTDRVNRLSYSPFNQYFILQALSNINKHDDGIASVIDMFGGQIEYGGTTFFETYRPQWNDELGPNDPVPNNQSGYTSLAHPWGAGVLTWLSEEVLGIKPTSPGFETFSVIPHLGRQLKRVSGTMPTPKGDITLNFDSENGAGNLIVPDGTTAVLGIPKLEKTINGIKINSQNLSFDSEDDDFVYFENLTAGQYSIAVEYVGTTPSFSQNDYVYSAEFIEIDEHTKGNWVSNYGEDGFVLCAYNDSDFRRLPSYVDSVKYTKQNSMQWSSDTDDERALESPDRIGTRQIGALYTNDPIACHQTFTVDIDVNEEKEYTVSLYFVDWTEDGRQVAVEMFDAETLNMIAPVKILTDYTGGKYITYKYNKSVRFRIDQVRGPNATLSGIFFDDAGSEYIPKKEAVYVDDQKSDVVYNGNWTHDPHGDCYNGTFSYSNVAGNYAEYAFKGDNISFISSKESNRGIADIYLDDKLLTSIDLHSAQVIRQTEVYTIDGLDPDAEHIIKIVVSGNKNPLATGAYVDIDAFVMYKPPTPFTITPSAGVGGKISPDTVVNAYEGNKKTFAITADKNYKISDVFVNGVSKGAISEYTFYNIMKDYTIETKFELITNVPSLSLLEIEGILLNPSFDPQTGNYEAFVDYDVEKVLIKALAVEGYDVLINGKLHEGLEFVDATLEKGINTIEITVYDPLDETSKKTYTIKIERTDWLSDNIADIKVIKDNTKVLFEIKNNKDKSIKGNVMLAIYNLEGVMLTCELSDMNLSENGILSDEFAIDVSLYPNCTLKVFVWNEKYMPLTNAYLIP